MKLSKSFIDAANSAFGWVNSMFADEFKQHSVKIPAGTVMPVLKDGDAYIVDSRGPERKLKSDTFVDAASPAVAVALQLQSRDPRLFHYLERMLHYKEDLPVSTGNVAPGAESYSYVELAHSGQAEYIGDGRTEH